MTNKQAYIVEPELVADAVVIWLHGLGADGRDFIDVTGQLGLPDRHAIRFIFPNAPDIPISINNGYVMPGWYDIYDLHNLKREDEAGILRSQQYLNSLIEQQIASGIASDRIILVGFSQGGAMVLYTGLNYAQPLGGVVALSAYLPLATKLHLSSSKHNHKTPFFIAHGIFDEVVPFAMGQAACTQLQQANYTVEWNTYPIAHNVDINEIHSIGSFIRRCLAVEKKKNRTSVIASTHQGIQLVDKEDIYYFQADHKYVITYHKKGQLLIDDSLDQLEQEFAQDFIRVHRKSLVAIKKIESLSRDADGQYYLKLRGQAALIKVSRRKLPQVRKLLLCM